MRGDIATPASSDPAELLSAGWLDGRRPGGQAGAGPQEPARLHSTTTANDAIAAWRDNGWEDLKLG